MIPFGPCFRPTRFPLRPNSRTSTKTTRKRSSERRRRGGAACPWGRTIADVEASRQIRGSAFTRPPASNYWRRRGFQTGRDRPHYCLTHTEWVRYSRVEILGKSAHSLAPLMYLRLAALFSFVAALFL